MIGPLLLGVFTASVVGSLHCAAMCGPLVAAFSAGAPPRGGCGRRRAGSGWSHAAYQAGRAFMYCFLGALAGIAGSAFDAAGVSWGVANLAAWLAAGALLFVGVGLLSPELSRALAARLPWSRHAAQGLVKLRTKPPVTRSALLGLATPLLPCGWLYAVTLTAAGTGDAWAGALVMLAFWAGSVPALLGVGWLLQRLSQALRQRAQRVAGGLLIAVALVTVFQRARMPVAAAATPEPASASGTAPTASGAAHRLAGQHSTEPPTQPACHH